MHPLAHVRTVAQTCPYLRLRTAEKLSKVAEDRPIGIWKSPFSLRDLCHLRLRRANLDETIAIFT